MHGAAWHPFPQLGGGKPACSRGLHSLKHHRMTHPHPVRLHCFLLLLTGEGALQVQRIILPQLGLGLVQVADHSSKTFLVLLVGENAAYNWHVGGEGEVLTIQASWKLRVLVTHKFTITVFINKMPYDHWSQEKRLTVKMIWCVNSLRKIIFVFLGQHIKNFFLVPLCLSFIIFRTRDHCLFKTLQYKHVSFHIKKLNTEITFTN